jgi:hypothetical protein
MHSSPPGSEPIALPALCSEGYFFFLKEKIANQWSWFQFPLHKDVIGCVYASGLQCWGGCFSKQVLQSVTALLGDKG